MRKQFVAGAAALMAMVGMAALPTSASALTIFTDNFNSATVGPQWSTNAGTLAIATAANAPNAKYLGQAGNGELGLSNQTVTLALTALQPHTNVTLSFDLIIIRTMDGDETFSLSETSAGNIVTSNFENLTFSNPFGGSNNGNGSNPLFGHADAEDSLGITPDGNGGAVETALYSRSFTFAHTAPNLNIAFTYSNLQTPSDEAWALDNVTVETDAVDSTVPLPASLPLMAAAIAGIAALARQKARTEV